MAADGNGGGGIAAVRPPPPFSQVAGPSGGRRKMVVAVLQPSDLRHHFAGRSGRCWAVWRQLAAAGPL